MSINAVDLTFTYTDKVILDSCSFQLKKGKISCILGRNGSGKTTLLHLLMGNLKPGQGNVLVDGYDIQKTSKKTIAKILGFVPQEHTGVFPYTVLNMVVMGRNPHLSLFGRPQTQDYIFAEEALNMVGAAHLKERPYMEISGGERQLVFLARAIAQEATYFILDEPTSHLDFCNQRSIMTTLRDIIQQRGCGAVIAMHDPNLTLDFADEVIMIKNGRIMCCGTTENIMTEENLKELYNMDIRTTSISNGRKFVYTM